MKYLHGIELKKREGRVWLIRRREEGDCDVLTFAWVNRERRYFICLGSNMSEDESNIWRGFRQESDKINTELQNLTLVIDQPKVYELYYNWCAMIYCRNCCRTIDNIYDDSGGRSRSEDNPSRRLINNLSTSPLIQNDGLGRYGVSIHLTPTKRKRQDKKGKVSANEL